MILFFFLDGIGLGSDDATINPFVKARTPFLNGALGANLSQTAQAKQHKHFVFAHLDARLGFEGLPQSATGQTTLLTGVNGAEIMGRHYGPYPGPSLKKELERSTLFSEVSRRGKKALLANVYPPGYFAALESKKLRVNVPVYAALKAGLALQDLAAYRVGRALSADLTGAYLHQIDPTNKVLEPNEAGASLANLASAYDFCFFDFWLSDHVGHRRSFDEAVHLIEQLDSFLSGLVATLHGTTLVVTSDHGNLEDKSIRTHTKNPVPLMVFGQHAASFANCTCLEDVAPSIRHVLFDTVRQKEG